MSMHSRVFLFLAMIGFVVPDKLHSEDSDGNIAPSADAVCPIKVGMEVPALTLAGVDGKPFDVGTAIRQKPTVLVFYRGGWCPYCNLQLKQLVDVEPQLVALGYQLLAISTDKPEKLQETLTKDKLNYTLLSDSKMVGSAAFGIAFKVEDQLVQKYKTYNIDLEGASGEKHHLLPVPSVFIVGMDGIIRFSYVNPNYKVRLDSEVMLAAQAALK
ncbi:MAG: peroxiredoxin-like family protein [bacterium]